MRVSSLSDERVIGLVSRYFVPVWFSRDFYQLGRPERAEQEEIDRIDRDQARRGLKGGNVCVFLLDAGGAVRATLPVPRATDPDNLVPFLKDFVQQHHLEPRDAKAVRETTAPPRVRPGPRSADGLLLHAWTRFEDPNANRGDSQDWVELTAPEWKALIPPADARPGHSWKVPARTAEKIGQTCYPPLPFWDVKDSKVEKSQLEATLVSVQGGEMLIRLEGTLELAFPFEGKKTDGRVTARLRGVLRYQRVRQAVTSLALASEEARYVWYWQDKPQPKTMAIAVEMEP